MEFLQKKIFFLKIWINLQREKLNILTMKNKKLILTALAAATISMGAFAQTDTSNTGSSKVKGPYITNSTGSNWFLGLGAGISTSFSKKVGIFSEFSLKNDFDAEIFVGKWFTPVVGTRVGYKGGTDNFGFDDKKYSSKRFESGEQIRFGYFHGDFLWNLSNAIGGYKENRVWSFIPYLGGGIFGLNDGHTDIKAAVSAGLYNEIRLNRAIKLYLDFALMSYENPVGLRDKETKKTVVNNKTFFAARPMYMPTANVGITINLSKKKNFDRVGSQAGGDIESNKPNDYDNANDELKKLQDDYNRLKDENQNLKDSLDNAKKEIDDLAKRNNTPSDDPNRNSTPDNTNVQQAKVIPLVIYFSRGSAVINDTEMAHFEQWLKVQNESTREQPITITGSADSHTGTAAFNQMLAQERANVLKKLLSANGFKNISTQTLINDSLGNTDARNRAAKIE